MGFKKVVQDMDVESSRETRLPHHEVSWLVGAMHLTISETIAEDNL